MKTLFRLIPLYAIASILGLAFIFMDILDFGEHGNVFMFILFLVLGLFSTISSFTSVFSHVAELGWLQQKEADLINAEEYLTEMKEHVKMITEKAGEFDENVLAKSNVDHPIVKAMYTLQRAQDDLESAKNQVNRQKASIAARKAGPFGWVVDVYGEKI